VDIFRKVDTMSRMPADSPSRRPHRRLTDKFKAGAIRVVLDGGKTVAAVARELDLTASALTEWVRRAPSERATIDARLRIHIRAPYDASRRA
jgi:transposase-like protein